MPAVVDLTVVPLLYQASIMPWIPSEMGMLGKSHGTPDNHL